MWWLSLLVVARAVFVVFADVNSAHLTTPKVSLSNRVKRDEGSEGGIWRTPREYQFVTRDRSSSSASRLSRLLDPEPSASRNYVDERRFYDDVRRNGDEDPFDRRLLPSTAPQRPRKRIIYYATLPEIVRRPGEWTPPRPIYGGGYPHSLRDNEVFTRPSPGFFSDSGTRVSSSIIGFSDKRDRPLLNSGYRDEPSGPKFTIIDAEPPYNYAHSPPIAPPPPRPIIPNRYDDRFNFDRNPYDYDRRPYDTLPYDTVPYASRYDRRPSASSSSNIPLPPVPFTVVRKPLDVRPLDPDSSSDFTTQGTPLSTTSGQPSVSSTSASSLIITSTSGPLLNGYERSFKL